MFFMDNDYILEAAHEKGEPVEVAGKSNGTVLLSSIQSQFPNLVQLSNFISKNS